MSRGWELKSDKALLVTSGLLFIQCNLGRRFHVPAPHILPNHLYIAFVFQSDHGALAFLWAQAWAYGWQEARPLEF